MHEKLEIEVCQDPVFVIGSPRSGTSMLAWSLAAHEAFWTTAESDFLYHLFGGGHLNAAWVTSHGRGQDGWIQRHGVSRSEFFSSVGLGLNVMISGRTQGRRWVDQTPSYTAMVETLADIFPTARFLHIMRDGRGVVNSMVRSGFAAPWATDFAEGCRTWAWYVGRAVSFGAELPDRYLSVSYDLTIKNPRDSFAGILEFLDAGHSDAPAEFATANRINSSYQADGANAAYPAPQDIWQEWTPRQREIFAKEAGDAFVEHRFGEAKDLAA